MSIHEDQMNQAEDWSGFINEIFLGNYDFQLQNTDDFQQQIYLQTDSSVFCLYFNSTILEHPMSGKKQKHMEYPVSNKKQKRVEHPMFSKKTKAHGISLIQQRMKAHRTSHVQQKKSKSMQNILCSAKN